MGHESSRGNQDEWDLEFVQNTIAIFAWSQTVSEINFFNVVQHN